MKAAGWTFLVIGGLILLTTDPVIYAGVACICLGLGMLARL